MKFINEKTVDFVFETSPFKHVVIDNFTPFYISNADFIDNITSLYSILRRAICVSWDNTSKSANTRYCSSSTG